MDPGVVVPFVVVGGIVAIGFGSWWFGAAQVAKRKLRAVPVQPISGLRPGERVKVSGRVVLERRRLKSPFRGVPCAYWAAKVREKTGKHYHDRAEQWESVPFWLDDGTGKVRIDPGGRKLPLPYEDVGRSGTFDDPTPEEQDALARLGLTSENWLGMNRQYRFEEASLDDDEQVAVIGEVVIEEIDGEPVLTLTEGAEGLVISDAFGVHD
jgi:hypothetical protein